MRRMFSENQIKKLAKYVAENDLSDVDLSVKSINAQGGAISGPLAVTGNSAIGGDLAVNGDITGGSIIENMSGYSFVSDEAIENMTKEDVYAGVVKNGNKITIVCASNITRTGTTTTAQHLGVFNLPTEVLDKLIPITIGSYQYLDVRLIQAAENGWTTKNISVYSQKTTGGVRLSIDSGVLASLTLNTKYYVRYEITFLLSDNLVPSE